MPSEFLVLARCADSAHRDQFCVWINIRMLTNTLIAVSLALAILIWAIVILRSVGHQFPTAYQLLRESPEITRREWIAVRALICLMLVFGLLLLTQLF